MDTHATRITKQVRNTIARAIFGFFSKNTWAVLVVAFTVINLYLTSLLVPVYKAIEGVNQKASANTIDIDEIKPYVKDIIQMRQELSDIKSDVVDIKDGQNKLLDYVIGKR